MKNNKKILSVGLCGVGLLGLLLGTPAFSDDDDDDMVLTSKKITQAITIDGIEDALWDSAEDIEIELDKTPYKPSNGYKGVTETEVSIKSLYDDTHVYFLLEYKDPTHSIERFPWMKQSDGSWKQLKAKDSTGHDNTYYEDKLAFFWNINASKFDIKGCAVACHKASQGKVNGIETNSPARKYTNPGESIDMWHWKGVRTNPNHQIDDQFVDSTNDPKKNKNWGRKGDSKTGGGYKNNVANDAPAFTEKGLTATSVAILDSKKVPFDPVYTASDRIPGIVTAPFEGSRGDIEAFGVWKGGVWTVEIKRALVTTGKDADIQDVQFKDLSKGYLFGVAVFDNSQINHVFHYDAYELVFK